MNIRDIAAAAHVSIATVSKIINHKDSEISNETRQRVLKVIKEYQYTPYDNLKASLQTFHTRTIAFLSQEGLFHSQVISDIEKEASRMGYSLVFCNICQPYSDHIRKHMKVLESRKIDGILVGISEPSQLEEIVSLNYSHIPLAAITAFSSDKCSTFVIDYCAIAEKAVSELIHLGHQKIGCIVENHNDIFAASCIEGYKNALSALSQYGFEYYVITQNYSRNDLQAQIRQLLLAKITAIFCQTTVLANAVYEILKEEKRYIPNNISVVCGEASPHSRYFIPELTCCTISMKEIASAAVEYLIHSIENHHQGKISSHLFSPHFLPGESIAPPPSTGRQILVVGNCNIDINIQLPHLPSEGSLMVTESVTILPGGKALAQAVGAGQLEGTVYALGCIGNDAEGQSILEAFQKAYVHTEGITIHPSLPTGKAYLCIPDNGNSSVITYRGANSVYSVSHIRPYRYLFETCNYCLISTEIHEDLVRYIIRECAAHHTEVFVKPSSIDSFPDKLLEMVTYFIPNVQELNILVPGSETYEEKAEYLYQKGCKNVIVTLGSQGCYLRNAEYSIHIPAADFTAVDTTGAANCLISAFAVSLSKGNSVLYALCYATYAAGISVTQPGVITSLPNKWQIEGCLDDIHHLYRSLSK